MDGRTGAYTNGRRSYFNDGAVVDDDDDDDVEDGDDWVRHVKQITNETSKQPSNNIDTFT